MMFFRGESDLRGDLLEYVHGVYMCNLTKLLFSVPQDYDAFWALLENHSPKEVSLILERMITCNHPSLGGKNKEKCDDIFAYILQVL